jgi:hypothetical protein
MTDDSHSPLPDSAPDEFDLLASRVLDGDVEPAERARAEADPAIAARIAAMALLRAELRDLPAIDPAITARAVAAALAVFDEQHGSLAAAAGTTTGAETPLAPVVPLRRRTGWSNALPWLGAAAAAAALVVGVASIGSRDGDDFADSPAADTQVEAREQTGPEVASAPESGDVTVMSAEDGVGGAPAESDEPVDSTGRIGDAADQSADTAVPMSGTEAPAATQAPPDQELSVAGDAAILEDPAALKSFADTTAPVEGISICAPDAVLLTTDALFGADPATAVVVEVVRDDVGDIVAYDVATCSETARVPRG